MRVQTVCIRIYSIWQNILAVYVLCFDSAQDMGCVFPTSYIAAQHIIDNNLIVSSVYVTHYPVIHCLSSLTEIINKGQEAHCYSGLDIVMPVCVIGSVGSVLC